MADVRMLLSCRVDTDTQHYYPHTCFVSKTWKPVHPVVSQISFPPLSFDDAWGIGSLFLLLSLTAWGSREICKLLLNRR